MLVALYIIVDDDFSTPVYADPASDNIDSDLWEQMCQVISDALEGEGPTEGSVVVGAGVLGWKVMLRNSLSFVCVVEDVKSAKVELYLKQLVRQYFDEVDDVRRPERAGVADVVVDVIPPWED